MAKYISKLQNKRVLVIGGTSGIGFCVAEAAVEYGAIVLIASSQQTKIDRSIERILKDYPEAKISGHVCDLSNPETVDEKLKTLLAFATQAGKLDHIVNTAGGNIDKGNLAGVTAQRFFAVQQNKTVASLLIGKYSVDYMNINKASSITFTGGVNIYKPGPGSSLAAASGAGLEGLTRGLAVDLKPVRVNMVAPGAILTEMWQAFGNAEQMKETYASKSLTGGVGSPEDTAEAYLYLMKDKFITGQYILTDGGYMLM